jgi:hypothetical protein
MRQVTMKKTLQKKLALKTTTIGRLTDVQGADWGTINPSNPIFCATIGTISIYTNVYTCAPGCKFETHGPTCPLK